MITKLSDKYFTVDARTILQLGRQSIKDHITALIELVKNSYDADASIVEVEIDNVKDTIRISDNGTGMSENLFDQTWLRIGYSAKRRATKSPSKIRRVVGEKGVGRISADRLGSELELRTVTSKGIGFSATVSWDAFDVDGQDLHNIPVKMRRGIQPNLPHNQRNKSVVESTGTELIVRHLRQDWTKDDIEHLVSELETLISPFDIDPDFEIRVKTNVPGGFNGAVQSTIPKNAALEMRATLFRNVISYEIIDRTHTGKSRTKRASKDWAQIASLSTSSRSTRRTSLSARTGPVELRLLYVPQHVFRDKANVLKPAELRDRTVGIRIYRDSVRVRPYGDPKDADGDWLRLADRKAREPAGVSRLTWRVAPTELAGAVFIGRDRNRKLLDSASREGLVHNEAFGDLRTLVLGCLRELEQYRHKAYAIQTRQIESLPALQAVEDFTVRLNSIEREWKSISKQADKDPVAALARAASIIESSIDSVKSTQQSVDTLVEQTRLYRGLSSLGIAASVFGHETQSAISMCLGNLAEVTDEARAKSPKISLILEAAKTAHTYAQKISAWGTFAVARVRHEKRKPKQLRFDSVVLRLVQELKPAYDATKTVVDIQQEPVTIRGHAMDIEAIALNLLTNAYTFSQDSRRDRRIRIEVKCETRGKRTGALLIVADSGPGVSKDSAEMIWEPLYTTKRDKEGNEVGTGLGLSIVDSIVKDSRGQRSVDRDPLLKGARFSIWIPGT